MKRFFISMAVCLMLLGSGRADAMSLNVQDGDVGELLRSIARMGSIKPKAASPTVLKKAAIGVLEPKLAGLMA